MTGDGSYSVTAGFRLTRRSRHCPSARSAIALYTAPQTMKTSIGERQ